MMVGQLANFIGSQIAHPQQSQQSPQQVPAKQTAAPVQKVGNPNPFNGNPFVSSTVAGSSQTFGKNMPVQGGFFAGYYNGQPNIVGANLFIEI